MLRAIPPLVKVTSFGLTPVGIAYVNLPLHGGFIPRSSLGRLIHVAATDWVPDNPERQCLVHDSVSDSSSSLLVRHPHTCIAMLLIHNCPLHSTLHKVETGQKCPACALLAGTRENGRWEPVSREKLENVCLCVWSAGAIVMYIKGRDKKCAENMDHLSPLRFASAVDIFGSEMRHKGALNVKRKTASKTRGKPRTDSRNPVVRTCFDFKETLVAVLVGVAGLIRVLAFVVRSERHKCGL